MDLGVVFSPLPGPPVGATRPFSDWMHAAETVCTTLVRAGFRYITHGDAGLAAPALECGRCRL